MNMTDRVITSMHISLKKEGERKFGRSQDEVWGDVLVVRSCKRDDKARDSDIQQDGIKNGSVLHVCFQWLPSSCIMKNLSSICTCSLKKAQQKVMLSTTTVSDKMSKNTWKKQAIKHKTQIFSMAYAGTKKQEKKPQTNQHTHTGH